MVAARRVRAVLVVLVEQSHDGRWVAVGPSLDGRLGHLEAGGDLADGPTLVDDELGDFESVAGSWSCICVGHGTP